MWISLPAADGNDQEKNGSWDNLRTHARQLGDSVRLVDLGDRDPSLASGPPRRVREAGGWIGDDPPALRHFVSVFDEASLTAR